MGGPIDMERKVCESMGCYTHFVTFNLDLNHGLDLWFSRSNFEKVLSQEWDGRLTWNERDVSQYNVGHMLWLSIFTSPMTLALDFQGQILKMLHLRHGMADWHGTKGMWVDRMLYPLCNFQLWPQPWPWPWIFKVKLKKKLYLRNGMADWHGTKGMWVDIMLDSCCDFHIERSPQRRFPDHAFMLHCTFFPRLLAQQGVRCAREGEGCSLAAFNVTLLILVLEIPFNF